MTEPIAVDVPGKPPAFSRTAPLPVAVAPLVAALTATAAPPPPAPKAEAPKAEAPKPAAPPSPAATLATTVATVAAAATGVPPAVVVPATGLLARFTKKQLTIGAAVGSLFLGIGALKVLFPAKGMPTVPVETASNEKVAVSPPPAPAATPPKPLEPKPDPLAKTDGNGLPALPPGPIMPAGGPPAGTTNNGLLPAQPSTQPPLNLPRPESGAQPRPPIIVAGGTEQPSTPPAPMTASTIPLVPLPTPPGAPPLPALPAQPSGLIPPSPTTEAKPALKQPDSLVPPVKQPDSLVPPIKQPDSLVPPVKQPDSLVPPIKQPDSLVPPVKQPDSLVPPIKQPDSLVPPIKQPDSLVPPVKQPDSLMPPIKQPDSLVPPVKQPDAGPVGLPNPFQLNVAPSTERKSPPPPAIEPPVFNQPGTTTGFTKPAGAAEVKPSVPEIAPKTTYDVDLHNPSLNDSYESISLEFYNDKRYAKALEAFNDSKPLPFRNGGYVNVPPIHVLKRKYPTLTGGAVMPVGGSGVAPPAPSAQPNWGAAAPTGRTAYLVPRGGMTLQQVAQQTMGSSQRWRDIYDLNPQVSKPDELLPAGTELKLPADARLP